jgi:YD repeat-containing protein
LHGLSPSFLLGGVGADGRRSGPGGGGRDMNNSHRIAAIALAAACLAGATAMASETVTYTYDARGRLVKVERSGTVNNGVKAEYVYDKGDNRTNVNVVSPN